MKNIVDIFQSALGLNDINAVVSDILEIFSNLSLQEDNMTSCMCCCCHDSCC